MGDGQHLIPVTNGMIARITGTVDVDQQGRVRHLHVFQQEYGDPAAGITNDLTFSDFGERVSVPVPSASQVTQIPQAVAGS